MEHRMAIYLTMKDMAFLKQERIVESDRIISTFLSVLDGPATIFFLKFADDCGKMDEWVVESKNEETI